MEMNDKSKLRVSGAYHVFFMTFCDFHIYLVLITTISKPYNTKKLGRIVEEG